MGSVEYGAKQAIENCLKVREGEKVVIITDQEKLHIAEVLRNAAEKSAKRKTTMHILEDYGERPEDGSNPLKLPQRLVDSVQTADVTIYCATIKPNEFESLRKPLVFGVIEESKRIRHAHMPNITEEIMKMGMSADYVEIQRLSREIYKKVKDAKVIQVTTEKGTDITAKFERKGSPKLKWVVCDGNLGTKGVQWSNLPDGEVFTCPRYISGNVVIDGCLGDSLKKYGDIEATPVLMDIKRGRVVVDSIYCANKQLEKELKDYILNADKNGNRIGEFAIGTNIGLDRIIGNLLQDEKFPGVHIAWGYPFPSMTGAKWESNVHCDGVIRIPTLIVDGHMIMENGKYLV